MYTWNSRDFHQLSRQSSWSWPCQRVSQGPVPIRFLPFLIFKVCHGFQMYINNLTDFLFIIDDVIKSLGSWFSWFQGLAVMSVLPLLEKNRYFRFHPEVPTIAKLFSDILPAEWAARWLLFRTLAPNLPQVFFLSSQENTGQLVSLCLWVPRGTVEDLEYSILIVNYNVCLNSVLFMCMRNWGVVCTLSHWLVCQSGQDECNLTCTTPWFWTLTLI